MPPRSDGERERTDDGDCVVLGRRGLGVVGKAPGWVSRIAATPDVEQVAMICAAGS